MCNPTQCQQGGYCDSLNMRRRWGKALLQEEQENKMKCKDAEAKHRVILSVFILRVVVWPSLNIRRPVEMVRDASKH
jgi:hypothetical protein